MDQRALLLERYRLVKAEHLPGLVDWHARIFPTFMALIPEAHRLEFAAGVLSWASLTNPAPSKVDLGLAAPKDRMQARKKGSPTNGAAHSTDSSSKSRSKQ
jgi:hypothetical protein